MKNFWITSTFVLLAIISFFAGFTAKGIDFTHWSPWLSAKVGLVLALVTLVIQLPALLSTLIEKIRGGAEDGN
ncbi:hypothetical protein BFR40_11965 [Brochothrix thermosphacta]|uniref:hypothetical protein n=1 Tax=Brochothrix thermosphacta TaxID=2756 RepID=UPI00083F8BB3|nr:hypothetical protein [Brochothrix thermosphacta]ODJ49416.1 hypothetical protein BFR40_11965 [Brochothrix thermosphacta]